MKLRNFFYSLLLAVPVIFPAGAQELRCSVVVNAEFAETSERGTFRKMEAAIASFMNETNWTNDVFQEEEKIKCNLLITIQEVPAVGTYRATVQVVSARPVYGTDYETIILNFADRSWEFDFVEAQNIIFDQNTFTSNLSSLLAFYAYIIIGYDYDTFSPRGGDAYFQKAWQVVNNAEPTEIKGWTQGNDIRNRYWLAENVISPQLEPLRELLYIYHREGLDLMVSEPEKTRKNISDAIKKLESIISVRPRTIALLTLLDAKEDELISLFSQGNLTVRKQVYNTLVKIDPSKIEEYKPIIN